ncbi:sensor histidine kinase [Haloarcula marina]|uniref:sensor histidine kinase n=1 Tax=Haloarcula marina TaxID=2961574 RepID=UPI0020B78721|nr:HAMP domain-containing sensor histidine kinase [Halomicroarcula marina]
MLVGTVYVGTESHERDIYDQQQQSVDRTANTTAMILDQRVRTAILDLRLLATVAGDSEVDTEMARGFLRGSQYTSVVVTDPGETHRTVAGPYGNRLNDRVPGFRTEFQWTSKNHTLEQSSAFGSEGVLILAVPLRDGNVTVGVVAATVPMDAETLFRDIRRYLPEQQTVRIVSERQLLYNQQRALLYEHSETISDPITATTSMETTNWEIIVRDSQSESLRAISRARQLQTGSVSVVVLVLSLFGIWWYTTTIRRVSEIQTGLKALEQGRYESRLSFGGSTEMTRIAAEFNELAQRLEERRTQLQVLSRVFRHNLRNDLTVALGRIGVLTERVDAETELEQLDTVASTLEDLAETGEKVRVVEDVLDGEKLIERPVDIVAVVDRAVSAVNHSGEITHDGPPECLVVGNELLGRAVREILKNTSEHAGAAPQVEIEVRTQGSTVELVVRDDGPGIPENELRVLEERKEDPLDHSNGVGLWLVTWIVGEAGGDVTAERLPTNGTEIRLSLRQHDSESE